MHQLTGRRGAADEPRRPAAGQPGRGDPGGDDEGADQQPDRVVAEGSEQPRGVDHAHQHQGDAGAEGGVGVVEIGERPHPDGRQEHGQGGAAMAGEVDRLPGADVRGRRESAQSQRDQGDEHQGSGQ